MLMDTDFQSQTASQIQYTQQEQNQTPQIQSIQQYNTLLFENFDKQQEQKNSYQKDQICEKALQAIQMMRESLEIQQESASGFQFSQEDNIQSPTTQENSLQHDINELKNANEKLEEEFKLKEGNLYLMVIFSKKFEENINQKIKQISELDDTIRCIKDEMDAKNKEIQTLNFNIELNFKEIQELNNCKDDYKNFNDQLNFKCESMIIQIQSQNEQIQILKSDLILQIVILNIQEKYQQLNIEFSHQNIKFYQFQEQESKYLKIINSHEKKLEKYFCINQNLQKNLIKLQALNESYSQQLKNHNFDNLNLQELIFQYQNNFQEIIEKQNQYLNSVNQFQEHDITYIQLAQENHELKLNKDALESENRRFKDDMSCLQENIHIAQNLRNNKEIQEKSNSEKLGVISDIIYTTANNLALFEIKNQQQNQINEQLQQKTEFLQNELDKVRLDHKTQTEFIKQKLKESENQLANQEYHKNQVINDLELKINVQNKEIKSLKHQLGKFDKLDIVICDNNQKQRCPRKLNNINQKDDFNSIDDNCLNDVLRLSRTKKNKDLVVIDQLQEDCSEMNNKKNPNRKKK